jgi:hypothetical protein
VALRNADELLLPAVRESIAALKDKTGADAALIKLAERYAALIDDAGRHCSGCTNDDCNRSDRSWAIRWIGPLLHDALESLGATPVARTRTRTKESSAPVGPSRLAALRAAHTSAS